MKISSWSWSDRSSQSRAEPVGLAAQRAQALCLASEEREKKRGQTTEDWFYRRGPRPPSYCYKPARYSVRSMYTQNINKAFRAVPPGPRDALGGPTVLMRNEAQSSLRGTTSWTTSQRWQNMVQMRIGLECEGGGTERAGFPDDGAQGWRRGLEVKAGLEGGGGERRRGGAQWWRRGSGVEAVLKCGGGAQNWRRGCGCAGKTVLQISERK